MRTRSAVPLFAALAAALLAGRGAAIDLLEPVKRVAVPKPVFVSACQRVYREARDAVRKPSNAGAVVVLPAERRELLDKYFVGKRVSRVRLHFGATTPRITILGFAIIDRPSAITFGDDVYFKREYRPDSDAQLALIAHELTHVVQYESPDFSRRYCGALYDADFRYGRNVYEKEAMAVEKSFAESLAALKPEPEVASKP